ncbi:MAG: hypothetical protein AAB317_04080 [Nitrospirota bacterium]
MYISGTGSYLPGEKAVTNEMLSNIFGSSVSLMGDYFGVTSRYFTVDYQTGEYAGEFNSDFCIKAAEMALKKTDLKPKDIGLIICSTNTPDTILPQVSASVQEKLQIPQSIILDIRGGCSSPLQSVLIAKSFIQNGLVNNALIIGSECFSTIYYPYLLKHRKDFLAKDLMNSLIFGDGAAAFLMTKEKVSEDAFIVKEVVSRSTNANLPPGFVVSLGGSKIKHYGEQDLPLGELMKLYPKNLERYLPKQIELLFKEISKQGFNLGDFKYTVGPQANKRLVFSLDAMFKKEASNYFYYGDVTGNVPGGALLLAFDKLISTKPIQSKEQILLMGVESPKWVDGYCVLEKV